jgi:hypothetical protein
MDCVVVSWIFNTISTDLLDVIHERDGITTRAAWLEIEQQFLNNRESRAMLLDAEFRTISQGALSIDDYCHKMKNMANALADLGEPISDRTLVLNILCVLNERFQFMAQLVTRQRPFPSFTDVRVDLRLAELNMAPPSTPPSALPLHPVGRLLLHFHQGLLPHVLRRRSSRSGSNGWHGCPWCLLPPGSNRLLSSTHCDTPSRMVSMGSTGPGQRLQHHLPHSSTKHL